MLRVGLVGEAAAARHLDSDLTVGQVGESHEFGLGNLPERSWLRGYVDANSARIAVMVARAGESVVKGRHTPEQALNLLGFQIVGEIQSTFGQGLAPLSPNYLPRKLAKFPGATIPLVASGQLRASITHVVVDKGSL